MVDQLNDFNSTRSEFKQWDILTLFYMLDTIRVNSKTLLYKTQIRYKERRHFFHYSRVSKKSCLSFH